MAEIAPAPLGSPEARESLARKLRDGAMVVLLALSLNLLGNGRTSLWDRDEPRFAGCTREMRQSGDWLHPTFNAQPRYDKPVLIYWLMLAGTALGGDNPFGARLVSSMAGAGTCLLVWVLGRRMFDRRIGLLAGMMAATAPILMVESKLATTDATLAFLLLACQCALWELGRRPSRVVVGVFWVGLALATLVKGPIGPALIAISGIVAWWWGGPSACWGRLRWNWGLSIYALVTAPWYVAIGIVTKGEFYRIALGKHVLHRMASGMETHSGFPGYYLVGTLVAFYPWSAMLPPALLGAWFRRRRTPAFGFLLGWVVGPLVLLEVVRTKLIHYYLPAYPACALLVAWLVHAVAGAEINLRRWPLGRVALALLTGVGIGTTVALVAGALVLPPGLRWPALATALVLGAGTLFAMERFQGGATVRAAWGLVGTWAVVLALCGAWLLPAAEPYRVSPIVGRKLAALIASERALPMVGNFKPPGVVYGAGRPIVPMQSRAELVRTLLREGRVVAPLTPHELNVLRGDPELVVLERDVVRGFNVETFRQDAVHLVVLRPSALALARRGQQPEVK